CYDELGQISNIVADLEKLREIENGNMVLTREPVDLLELAQAVRIAFEPELERKQLTCVVTGDSSIILGDQKRLHQVIFNLVSNAIKYSTEGGHIQIRVCDGMEADTLTVEDHGIGIPDKDLPLIFERFYRTDRSRNRKTGGAGIGLAIVKAIVQAHNGKISVESKEGGGSRFIVTLPKR
ncbi:MAG: sensor histidine kinase, partial [Lachnospiraceae bacterium]